MPPKHIKIGQTHGYVGEKPKSKAKPRDIDVAWIEPYWLWRDRVIYKISKDEETITAIKERYKI